MTRHSYYSLSKGKLIFSFNTHSLYLLHKTQLFLMSGISLLYGKPTSVNANKKKRICALRCIHAPCMFLTLTSHMRRRSANMDGDGGIVEIEDQEIYGRRCESQTAISAALAYVCISKKKSQKPKFRYYMNLKA